MTDTFSLLAPWQDLGVLDISDVHLAATLAGSVDSRPTPMPTRPCSPSCSVPP